MSIMKCTNSSLSIVRVAILHNPNSEKNEKRISQWIFLLRQSFIRSYPHPFDFPLPVTMMLASTTSPATSNRDLCQYQAIDRIYKPTRSKPSHINSQRSRLRASYGRLPTYTRHSRCGRRGLRDLDIDPRRLRGGLRDR